MWNYLIVAWSLNTNRANLPPSPNCAWQAAWSDTNFRSEHHLRNLDSCRLLVRGNLFGRSSLEVAGTLVYTSQSGSKHVCMTSAKLPAMEPLSGPEQVAFSLKAELDGHALSLSDRAQALETQRQTKINMIDLLRKLDETIAVDCAH